MERVAAAIGAELAVLIREGKVAASIGFPKGEEPVEDLVEASGDLRFERKLGDLGACTGICSLVGEEGVIAEGIESRRQAAMLGERGCYHGQGFHHSPPLPAEEISAHLAAGSAAR